ncbi:MAG: SDR family oxidoreductase [Oscillospiraceae bacterium]|nr:SDR family oxidoreductase [Oscillospiraceae bacterium]
MSKVAVVTGGSSGIGLNICRALADSGCTVYELSRRSHSHEGVTHISADVSDEQQVKSAIDSVVARQGRIDILICNAGFGISGCAEFTENADAKKLMDVNLFGVVNAVKAAIPHMREAGGGRIVCTSSVAGVVPIPFQSWYSVSKSAINAYTGALCNELKPFGISVCAVMPGDTRTGFTSAREKSVAGDDVYGGRISRSVGKMEKDEQNGNSPEKAGQYICRIALKPRVKPLYTIGFAYKFLTVLNQLLPSALRSFILGILYSGK